jgi:glycosyltransferase involved in cell wall biosynthesis
MTEWRGQKRGGWVRVGPKRRVVLETSGLQRGHAFQGTGRFIRMLERALHESPCVDVRTLAEATAGSDPDIVYKSIRSTTRVAEMLDLGARTLAWRRWRRSDEVLLQPTPYFQVMDSLRSIVGILDLVPLELPHCYARTGTKARLLYRLASRARSIITISEFSKERIVQRLQVGHDRITVAPLYSSLPIASASESPILEPPYLLSVCDLRFVDPRKRLDWLVELARRVVGPRQIKLAFVGALGSYSDLLRARARDAGVNEVLVFLGRVSDSDLASLYAQSEGLLFPSQYEGFGLPCVEALAQGCPAVVTRTTCLPEVVQLEELIAEDSFEAFCGRVAWVLDHGRSTDLRRRARARASAFTPERFARQVLTAVERLQG